MAIATDKKGLKVKAAYKELSTQAKRIQKYYRDRMKFYDKLSNRIETPEGLKEYNAIYNNAPVIEKEIADIYINTDSTGFKFKRSEGFGYGMEFGQTELRQTFNQYRIRYQLFSNEVQANEDVSELLTFGLTNRDFQEMLEYIPLGKDATGSVWNKFVETIRKLLEIPAKLNTELSAFLKNASTALDLKEEGIQAPFVPASEREVSQDIPTFSRAQDIGSPLNEPLGYRLNDRILESWLKYHNYENLNERPGAPRTEGEIDLAYRKNDPVLNESYIAYADRIETYFSPYNDKISKKTYKNPTHKQLLIDFDYLPAGDIPTFSREADQAYFDREKKNRRISNLESSIYSKEAQLNQERGSMTDATARRLEREIQQQKNEIAELRAGDIPTFSRASTATEPAYMDLTRADISQFTSFDEYRNIQGEKIPNAFVMRMPIDAYLKLTTPNQDSINKIKNEVIEGYLKGYQFGKFDPSQVDDQRYPIYLDINSIGKVYTHEGRHRAALLQLEDAQTIPVVIRLKEKPIFDDKPMSSIKSINDLGIFTLGNQFKGSRLEEDYIKNNLPVATDYSFDLTGQDIAMVRRFVKEDIDNAVRIANAPDVKTDMPLFSRGQRFNDGINSQKNIKLADALAEAEETVKQTPRGSIPFYNLNASDMALEVALEFNKDLSAKTPEDIPTFSRPGYDGIDSDIAEASERLGGKYQPDRSWGARTIEAVKDPITSINNFFKNFRQNFVDKLDAVDKKIMQASEDNEQVRLYNNTADTATMAALRLADRARGLFQGMLTRGYVSDVIEGNSALANVKYLELQNGKTGGLIQILAPLFSNPEVNLEKVFKLYATLKRAKTFDETGREIDTPVKPEDYALIQKIEEQHPEVVEVYNNYQTWNNKLIDFAEKKGLLDPEQAEMWRQHSSYYPFYRNMVDDTGISAPVIAGGSLPNNPLSIKIEGSEDIIDVDPIEAISRNSLSILTAALKNDGTAKLLRDLQSIGEARPVTPKQASKLNTIFVFENGNKQFYEVDDVNLFHGIQGIGGVNTGTITKILAFPAGVLRDTVTRDPGFVVINILRDTMSSAITSGAPYTPIIDSTKNMFRDMEDLEKFGVLGGYDFSNDEGSVKQFITRTMRQKGLTPENGMSASGAFFKIWDGLGALTTKSDGATRLAVYEGVYKKLKNQGYTEAQAQSEAAFQALEIINFGRRGLDPMFRVVTAAIPFLNARIQGLDVLYRGLTGKYSSVEKLQEGETLQDVQSRILRRAALRGGLLVTLTGLYYMMVSDSDEYKNLKREVRDDNWVIPIGDGNAVKIPIPFEVGMLFKAIPERLFDMTLGDDAFTRKSVDEALTSTARQLGTSANIPFFQPGAGLQLLKPIAEVYNNKNTFTNTEIVPYYQQKKELGLQSRATTNELARVMGEFLNISPAKIEHIMRGYTGTLGGYVLTVIDTVTRGATGSPLLPSNFQLSKMPVFNRLLLDLDKSGGYQQQFYELRNEVDRAVQTMNSLKKQQRFDELSAYRSNMQGLLNVKGQVRAIDRYLANWRERRDRIIRNENLSLTVKSDMLRDLELERDMRLAMIPELRKKANIPVITLNL